MTIDLEGDLRREFDAATPPSSLNFHPESVLRQGATIRRHRILVGGSAAMVVVLLAAGVGLLNRPQDPTAPRPATGTATFDIVRAKVSELSIGANLQIEFNRDPKVTSNVKIFVVDDFGGSRELDAWSIKPGQKPDAIWKSVIVDGVPFTVGLCPGIKPHITLDDGSSGFSSFAGATGFASMELKGIGYTMFVVDPSEPIGDNPNYTVRARPGVITSIRWTGPNGIIDGIEGDHRLTGRVLTLSPTLVVDVVLRPGKGGQTVVFGDTRPNIDPAKNHFTVLPWSSVALSVATTDASGAAVMTGRYLVDAWSQGTVDGPPVAPIAAGILPPGASGIGVILTTGKLANGLPVTQLLPDGRVIFAVKAESGKPSRATKDSIKAVTWINADGSHGRKNVTQHES